MSDLQIGLLVIGAAIVVAVLVFNWIQERRFRKQAEAAFQAPEVDALKQAAAMPRVMHNRFEPALREPVFDADSATPVDEANEPRWHIDAEQSQLDEAPVGEHAKAAPIPVPAAAPNPAPGNAQPPAPGPTAVPVWTEKCAP
jgi:hypothetical protein